MSENKTCGECLWCIKEEGPPYYCALRDLYYLVTPNDKACEWFSPETSEVKQPLKRRKERRKL